MAVHHVGIEIQKGHNLHRAAAEEREPFAVVVVSVAAGAFEIVLVVHEIVRYVIRNVFENPAILISPGKRNEDVSDKAELLPVFLSHVLIERNDNAHVVALIFGKRLGERTDDLRQSARRDKRRRLRGNEQNFLLRLHLNFGRARSLRFYLFGLYLERLRGLRRRGRSLFRRLNGLFRRCPRFLLGRSRFR